MPTVVSNPDAARDDLLDLYRSDDWWADRDPEDVRAALAGTDEHLALREADRLVASARVLTDYRYDATVYGVIVAADRRGEGLGRELLAAVTDHEALSATPGITLLAREGLVDFYASCGFEVDDDRVEHPDGPPEELRRLVWRRE